MPRKTATLGLAKRLTQLLEGFSKWRGGIGIVILIVVLALLTRTVDLSSFPYFPPEWPWNGVNGLYIDEYATSLLPFSGSAYFPFLQVTLMGFAISILGYNAFAIRLLSALFSSITSVLVYLSADELFRNKLAALLSSLFFIFMTPALIYGRMAFVENGAATFFVLTFLFALKYLNAPRNLWLVGSAVSAGLSFLCKQTGIVAIAFLVLFLFIYKPEAFHKLIKPLLIIVLLIFAYLMQVAISSPSSMSQFISTYVDMGIRSADWFNILLTTSMPSGHTLMWYTFPEMLNFFWNIRVDYWYIFVYFIVVYFMIKEKQSVYPVVLAISLFILLLILLGHGNVYYIALIQPFMAIPVGYGLLKLQRMSGVSAFAFSILLCFPAITYINYYFSYFLISGASVSSGTVLHLLVVSPLVVACFLRLCNQRAAQKPPGTLNILLLIYYAAWLVTGIYVLSVFYQDIIWVIMQFTIVIPVVILGILRLSFERMGKNQSTTINRFFLIFYAVCLIIGSYALPVFYPGYFAQSIVPK